MAGRNNAKEGKIKGDAEGSIIAPRLKTQFIMARDTEYDRFKKNKSPELKKIRHYLEYVGARLAKGFSGLWGVRVNQKIGAFLGRAGYYLVKRDRGIAEYQLNFCFPELSEKERKKIIKDSFASVGKTLFEALAMDKVRRDMSKWLKPRGVRVVREALESGKGAVVLFSHTGNWEFVGLVFEMLKIRAAITYKPVGAEKLNRFLLSSRRSQYIDLVPVGDKRTPRLILKRLKNNEIFLLSIDQDVDIKSAVFVDFFGRQASTTQAPAFFAQKFDLPVISAFGARMDDGSHRFFFKLLSQGPYQKGEEEIRSLTQTYTSELEQHIRKFPSQWVWFHRRWKNQP